MANLFSSLIFSIFLFVVHCEMSNDKTSKVFNDFEKKVKFIPTDEWQEIESCHIVPSGLHYRMNLETGRKEAKLITEDQKENQALVPTEHEDSVNRDELEDNKVHGLSEEMVEALKKLKNEDPDKKNDIKRKFRSMEELKDELEHLDFDVETEAAIIKRLIELFPESEDQMTILEELDYLLHQVDNALDFCIMGGLEKVISKSLNSSDSAIRLQTISLIGAAAQNNPKVQIRMLEAGLLKRLLYIMTKEGDMDALSKTVYAVSCLLRGFPFAQQYFAESGGFDVLRRVTYRRSTDNVASFKIQIKVLSLIENLLQEPKDATGERSKQLEKINLPQILADSEWCKDFLHLLSVFSPAYNSEDDTDPIQILEYDGLEKSISVMRHLSVTTCKSHFQKESGRLGQIASAISRHKARIAMSSQHDVMDEAMYKDIETKIYEVIGDLKEKEEL